MPDFGFTRPVNDHPCILYTSSTGIVVSRGQTAFFHFSLWWPPPQRKTEKSGLAAQDYWYSSASRCTWPYVLVSVVSAGHLY